MQQKAIVIGAGLAGLAAAIRLSKKGIETHVFEANSFPGGKVNSKEQKGYRFDQGPSLLTCPEYIEELYTLCGKDFTSFEMIDLETSFTYFFNDGLRMDLKRDQKQVIDEIAGKLGEDPLKVKKYLKKAETNYNLIAPLFIEKSLHRTRKLFGKNLFKALAHLPKYKLLSTMAGENSKFFKNPRTIQIFNRFAQYNGSHPYLAPAMLNMISHLEINIGPYQPKRGMIQISDALYAMAKEQGVTFHFNEKVSKIQIKNNSVSGVQTANGSYESNYVISNMDVAFTYEKLLPKQKQPRKILNQEKSSSAIVFYWGIKKSFPELNIHNMFFSDEDKQEFDSVFIDKEIHSEPSLYLYISSKINPSDAPQGCENWFVSMNAPIDQGQDWDKIIDEKREFIIQKLSKALRTDIRPLIEIENILDPRLIEKQYSGKNGSIYGNASNNRFSAFYRHPNYSKRINGLYFAGVSVHPGGGIPLALNSAKIACECLFDDFSL
jgi:phytoene desaturase